MKLRTIKPEKNNVGLDVGGPSYPQLYLNLKHLPEAKKWSIGEDYHLSLKVRQTNISQSGKGGNVGFDIRALSPVEESKTTFLGKKKKMSSSDGVTYT